MIDVLRQIDGFGLHYIEQPLHWDDLTEHAYLAQQLHTPICLDESLTSPARVKAALDLGSCSVVNVKVARVGGLQAAREINELCLARGVPMWCGGMLETGIGRAHNIHIATMHGFVYPGDTASASRTYARDIVEQKLEAVDGFMPVPEGAGTGVTLDRPFLQDVTRSVEVLR
jgi:O-succinylbenzoate synthase